MRWKCKDCGHVGEDLQSAPHPFRPKMLLYGCSVCGSFDLIAACWACDQESSGGAMFGPDDYRRYCFEHGPKEESPEGLATAGAME